MRQIDPEDRLWPESDYVLCSSVQRQNNSREPMEQIAPLDGRSCQGCTLCCKVLSIKELAKPQGEWCPHCDVGKGCKVYAARPSECGGFYCGYLTWPMAGDHWLPAECKMVIVSELDGARIAIHVDPSRPEAWREEPYYSEIKEWSCCAAEDMMQVVVCVGNRATVILPDRDVYLGAVADDERIVTFQRNSAFGLALEALKLKADDPRLARMQPGKPFSIFSGSQ